MRVSVFAAILTLLATPALAGPPYITDDPEPTEQGHYEIYLFGGGTAARDGSGGEGGIDFNYGGAKDLQLTAVIPLAYDSPRGGPVTTGFGTVELAAKYKFLHQEDFGIDVAVFPRIFLPTRSDPVLGSSHPAYYFPLFAEKDWGDWSLFGGGGCTINRGGTSQDFCNGGITLTRKVLDTLTLGAELYHQTPGERGGRHSSGIGFGAVYDLSENYHLMASAGPGIQNASETNRYTWYAALQLTF